LGEIPKSCSYLQKDLYKCLHQFRKSTTEGKLKKNLYSIIKAKRTEIIGVNDATQTKDADIAKILNKQLTSVFSDNDGFIPTSENTYRLNELTITRNGIVKLLNNLKPNTASGPDEVSARIIKVFRGHCRHTCLII